LSGQASISGQYEAHSSKHSAIEKVASVSRTIWLPALMAEQPLLPPVSGFA
jgi:hypothetical protein